MKMEMLMNPGEKFEFCGYKWICLDPSYYGDGILAIMANLYTNQQGDKYFKFNENGDGNYKNSKIRNVILEDLAQRIGTDKLIPKNIDLIADNGDDSLGFDIGYVSLMTADDFRKYRKLLPSYNDEYIWTCTPWKIDNSGRAVGVRLCSAGNGGGLYNYHAITSYGVAPLIIINPTIFQSHPLGCIAPLDDPISDDDIETLLGF